MTNDGSGIQPKESFLTGSSLVLTITPKDRDIVCLFDDESQINAFAESLGSDETFYGDTRFLSVRDGETNYLCTADLEFFYRFKAYSGVLDLFQITDKKRRVRVAKAALYWEDKGE